MTDLLSSSISSSGHVDRLGRRSPAFDRESGAMLERLYLRPELAVFEQILKRRIEQIQSVEDERIARPRGVERDASTGELVVVAEFVAGSRLSDLLDASSDEAVVPGVDVALGFLIDGLEALSSLHTISRGTHGLIDPSRTIITADGQVVFVDAAFGAVIERLHLSSERLWNDYGAAGSPAGEPGRFDPTRDVTQVALGALMLVLGRNLRREEYPDAIPSLLMEVIEVAQIRGSSNFAGSLQKFLQRSLPLPGRRPFTSADEALGDLRPLVRREIGLEACRQAMIDFVAQMDAAFANTETDAESASGSHGSKVPALDQLIDSFETVEPAEANNADGGRFEIDSHDHAHHADSHAVEEDDDSEELELSLEQIDAPPQSARREEPVEEIYDLPALDDFNASHSLGSDFATYKEPEIAAARVVEETPDAPAADWREEHKEEHKEEDAFAAVAAEISQTPVEEPAFESVAPAIPEVVEEAVADERTSVAENASPAITERDPEPEPEKEPEKEQETGSSRRRKRQQQKSARARKDKLRSTTTVQKLPPPPPVPTATPPPPPPPPPPPRPASPSGWLVSPQRAAASEHLIPESAPLPPRPVPSVPSFSPSPVGMVAQPTYAAPSASTSPYGAPSVIKPAPPAAKPIVVQPPPASPAPVKIKSEQPVITPKRAPEPITTSPVDRFSTLSLGGGSEESEATRAFPWKLALVALIVAAVAIVLGRSYLPGRSAVPGEAGAQSESAAASAAAASAAALDNSAIPAGKGRISVQTQPPGLKVLLDRKPIGETPLSVDTTPGRHALTFITSGGEVVNNIRVTAGKVTALDIPVFSGWLSLVSPFVVNIAENGQSIGSSEESRLMLPPGRHRLTFSSKELGFSQSQDVDIEPGGVKLVSIDPKGNVNLNANPWAEVYLDGVKLGDTPLAGIQVRLGTREFVFKNPQFGETRITATVRGGREPQVISHDFAKQ